MIGLSMLQTFSLFYEIQCVSFAHNEKLFTTLVFKSRCKVQSSALQSEGIAFPTWDVCINGCVVLFYQITQTKFPNCLDCIKVFFRNRALPISVFGTTPIVCCQICKAGKAKVTENVKLGVRQGLISFLRRNSDSKRSHSTDALPATCSQLQFDVLHGTILQSRTQQHLHNLGYIAYAVQVVIFAVCFAMLFCGTYLGGTISLLGFYFEYFSVGLLQLLFPRQRRKSFVLHCHFSFSFLLNQFLSHFSPLVF